MAPKNVPCPLTVSNPMTKTAFAAKLKSLQQQHARLIRRRNRPQAEGNGIFDRYEHPVLTASHARWPGVMTSTRPPTRT